MSAEMLRHYLGYHIAENGTLWAHVMSLTDAQFNAPARYSHGSVKEQVLHMVSVDETWFCGLRQMDIPEPLNPADFPDRASIRTRWDAVEADMVAYLAALKDEQLNQQLLSDEDAALRIWQVLLHVVNHGTDHRAQLLRQLNDMGVKTRSQDYIFYVYDNPN